MGSTLAHVMVEGELDRKDTQKARKSGHKEASPNVKPAKTLSKKQKNELILSHQEQGLKIAWRLLSNWRIKMQSDEVSSIVGIALCEAASRFDTEKGASFGTFLFYHIRGTLLKEITSAVNERRVCKLGGPDENYFSLFNSMFHTKGENPLVENNTPEKIIQKQELKERCKDACSQLDELEQTVIVRHYVHEESLVHISKDLSYCRCHISRVKNNALEKLAKLLIPFKTEVKPDSPPAAGPIARLVQAKRRYTGGRGRRKLSNEDVVEEEKISHAG